MCVFIYCWHYNRWTPFPPTVPTSVQPLPFPGPPHTIVCVCGLFIHVLQSIPPPHSLFSRTGLLLRPHGSVEGVHDFETSFSRRRRGEVTCPQSPARTWTQDSGPMISRLSFLLYLAFFPFSFLPQKVMWFSLSWPPSTVLKFPSNEGIFTLTVIFFAQRVVDVFLHEVQWWEHFF